MAQELPQSVALNRLGGINRDGAAQIEGDLHAARLTRISGLFQPRDAASVALSVTAERDGWHLGGRFEIELMAECQRCLESMNVRLRGEIDASAVASEDRLRAASELDEAKDFVLAPDGELDLAAFIEDEILLALPMIPLHSNAACGADQQVAAESAEQTHKPFAALASLLEDPTKG